MLCSKIHYDRLSGRRYFYCQTEDRQALYLRDEQSWVNFKSGNLIIITRSIDCLIKKQFAIIHLGDTAPKSILHMVFECPIVHNLV